MSFPFDPSQPAANTPPSVSRGTMQSNFNSIFNLISVDHVGFGNNSGGTHEQVTFNANNVPGSSPTGNVSILFTQAGVAASSPQLKYINTLGTFHVNAQKAWGYVVVGSISGNPYVPPQSVNVANVQVVDVKTIAVTLTANAVVSANFATLITTDAGTTAGYIITGTGAIQISFSRTPTTFSFEVLQI